MPRKTLVDVEIRGFKPAAKSYKKKDSNGLWLHIEPNGSKLWRYRFKLNGKESMCSLGDYNKGVTLADARKIRDAMRQLVVQGVNPSSHRKALRHQSEADAESSFESVARAWMRSKKKWRASYRKQVETVLGKEVFPVIGTKPMDKVTAADLRGIIKPIDERGAPTIALLIRQWSVAIGHYAIADGKAEFNAAASLKGLFEVKERKHHEPLTEVDIPVFIARLDQGLGTESVRIALRLLLLAFVRPGELRCAEWHEFDAGRALWKIPAARMKKNRPHEVPLSRQVLKLLERLKAMNLHPRLLFPNIRDAKRPMSPTTLNRFLERLGYGGRFSAHGFRATASTILHSKGFNPDAIERQLAHVDPSPTRRAYNQADYMPERTKMLQEWADYIDGISPTTAPSDASPQPYTSA